VGVEDKIFNLSPVNYLLYLTNTIFSIKLICFFTKGQSKPSRDWCGSAMTEDLG
jgi:hypothetical protein